MQTSYDEYADLADVHGGPAVIETFGEKPFSPVSKPESWAFTEAQQKLQLELDNESGQITNRYIKGEERSFTIIAYPIPEMERISRKFSARSLRSIHWIIRNIKRSSRRS